MHTINLGDKVRDMVTGFVGIAVARTQWLNGCVRIAVQSDKLEIVKRGAVKVEIPAAVAPVVTDPRKTGGPMNLPKDTRGGPIPR